MQALRAVERTRRSPQSQFTEVSSLLEGCSQRKSGRQNAISANLPAKHVRTMPRAADDGLCAGYHGSNSGYAAVSYLDADAAACGELVLAVVQALGVALTKPMADALYVAISTDTGCFCFGNTTADTLRAAALCLQAGADHTAWNRILFLTKTQARLHLEAYLSETAAFYAGGQVCICALPQAKLDELNITEDEIATSPAFRAISRGCKSARCCATWRTARKSRCAPTTAGTPPKSAGVWAAADTAPRRARPWTARSPTRRRGFSPCWQRWGWRCKMANGILIVESPRAGPVRCGFQAARQSARRRSTRGTLDPWRPGAAGFCRTRDARG